MRRIPTNIALTTDLRRRVRVIAAKTNVRVSIVVEQALLSALPEMELQASADEGRNKEEGRK